MDLANLHFQNPEAFFLLLLGPLLILDWWWHAHKRKSTIKFPALAIAKKAAKGSKVRARYIVPALRMAALCCFVVALAAPCAGRVECAILAALEVDDYTQGRNAGGSLNLFQRFNVGV